MRTRQYLLILVLIIIGYGCTYLGGYLDILKSRELSDDYLAILDSSTRSKTVYSEFETRVTIRATHKTPEFNRAYLEEYARVYGLTQDDKEKKKEVKAEFASDYSEFLFYAYTPDKDANDFDRARSIWRVYILYDNEKRLIPVEIRKIDNITPVHTAFYPYINPYHGFSYILRFSPPIPSEAAFKLVFASVIGKVELEW